MTKEEVLNHLKIAKSAHIEWVNKAKTIIRGSDDTEKSIPIDARECEFGKWFHYQGQILNGLSNNPLECMQNIETLHARVHEIYFSIFHIYFPESTKKGLLSKIFGEKQKVLSPDEKAFADEQFVKLEAASKELLDELSRLERRLVAVSDEKIEALEHS